MCVCVPTTQVSAVTILGSEFERPVSREALKIPAQNMQTLAKLGYEKEWSARANIAMLPDSCIVHLVGVWSQSRR